MPRLAPHLLCLLGLLLAAPLAHAQEAPPWGTGESQGEDLTLSLLTFGPGDDVASFWGHGALVVEDRKLRWSRLYNYGMFSFDERMLMRYAMGRLEFWVDDASPQGTVRYYQRENRDVRAQELNLTPAQRKALGLLLAVNVQPENRDYLYQHYNDNCVTRLRDAIDTVVGGQLHQALDVPGRMTLREHTRRYTAASPPISVLLDFAMNDEIDKPITRWQEAFLPDELERRIAEVQVVGEDGQKRPLQARADVLYAAKNRAPTPAEPPRYAPVLLGLGLAMGALSVGLALWERRRGSRVARVLFGLQNVAVGLVFGLPGLLLFIMWVVTDHTVVYHNENLFLANPLTVLALPLGVRWMMGKGRESLYRLWRGLAALGVLGLGLKLLPSFDQDNWRIIALLLPVLLGMGGATELARAGARTAPEPSGSRTSSLNASRS